MHPLNTPESESDQAAELEDLRASALSLLDFDEIRLRLADQTTFHEARRLALEIEPSFDPHEVGRLQDETADACALLEEIDDLSLDSDSDTTELVTRAALGGILSGGELLAVAGSLEVHSRARNSISRASRIAPLMADLASVIPDLRELRRQIRSKINVRGDVADDATPSLRALRSQVRSAHERVTEALQQFIGSNTGRDALQEPIISVRGDRLVVPVRADRRHRVAGIVHDASNTGATVFVEPFTTVELCNDWRELALEEEREVTRVLRDLSTLVGAVADDIRIANRTTAKLDLALARARYSRRLDAVTPATAAAGQRLRLIRARHPLLEDDVVPLTAHIGPDWSALVITGPNTGGKTVAMKTAGLAALMHQSGLRVPADEGSALPVFDGVFADIGDQQSISDSVSTFGSHILNVGKILRHAGPQSLVLLDELGTSTDPEEGSALAKAVISHLANSGAATIVTTHHRSVAAFADTSDGMLNASFQLDPDTLAPTYEMTIGTPGRSYAMAVAERLGLPSEILEEARNLIEPQHLLFEDWLTELQRERQQLLTNVEEASKARAEVESLREELEKQVDFLVNHRDDLMESTRRSILQRFQEISRRLDGAEASLRWGVPAVAGGSPPPTYDRVERIRRDLASVEVPERAPVQRVQPVSRPLQEGDKVFVRGMNLTGEIVEIHRQSDEAEVSIGRVRVTVDLHRLSRVDSDHDDDPEADTPRVTTDVSPPMQSIELDIRGMRAADAQVNLDEFLDRAILDGASKLRVIHGRGSGVLRNVVRDHLRYHRSVSDFGPEPRERGGNGATWVQMA
ncbi:MAG: endonuclease MutS2 [Dehalococcoidia bacterium]|nr:endonuclease MutS2 [Dehalococcoidia bacterium]